MKARKMSQVSLLASIVLAIIALWAGAAPFTGSSVDGIGGVWVRNWLAGPYWKYVAADTWGGCVYCYGTFSDTCADYVDGDCFGGYVTGALCSGDSSAGGTTHAGGSVACWDAGNSSCDEAADAWCF